MAPVSKEKLDGLYAWCGKPDAEIVVTSPETWVYNCIAFAMGSQSMWIASGHPEGWYAWWPETVTRNDAPQSLIEAFMYMGFERCADAIPENGYDKVVLYQKRKSNGSYGWTHAAKVIGDHQLHSKLGSSFDIHHRDGNVFESCEYGEEYAYMRRPIADRHKTDQLLPHQCEVCLGNEVHMIVFKGIELVSDTVIGFIKEKNL